MNRHASSRSRDRGTADTASAPSEGGPGLRETIRGSMAMVYLGACLLLGGASGAGAIANGFLQLTAIVLMVIALWGTSRPILPREAAGLTWVVGLFVLLVLLYLVPLPGSLWTALPGREPTERGFALLGLGTPSIPVSLAPERSIASLLSLLPPAAIFLLAVHLSGLWRRRLGWVLLLAAVASIILSAFQLIGGDGSPLRFYQITNPNRAVGFFASANHLPTLILCALPFTGLLAARALKSRNAQRKGGGLTIALGMGFFLVVGIAFSGSTAGYGLLLPALLGTILIYRRAAVGPLSRTWALGVGGLFLLFLAVALSGPLNQQVLSSKFSEHETSRATIWEGTVSAASDFLPVGSGLGTFIPVYRTYDDPGRANREYVNHAHNDYLEVALELGIAGLLLILGFLAWFLRRCVWAWRGDFYGADLARAGTVIIGILLLHSIVDYPLRTTALAALFGMASAFLIAPSARRSRSGDAASEDESLRHLEA